MTREFKPGDVAMVTEYGPPVPAVRAKAKCGNTAHTWVGRDHWHYLTDLKGCTWTSKSDAEARPLVVVDLEPHHADFVIGVLERAGHSWTNKVADALRPIASPPKPAEPTGLGAVVRDDGTRWTLAVRIPGSFPWVGEHGGVRGWNEFSDAAEVLSEGVIA